MKKTLIIAILMLAAGVAQAQIQISVEDREKAASLVKQMTLEEKCALITGQDDGFHTAAIERLGIPSVRMADGPQGVRNKTRSTYYPCGLSLAARRLKRVPDRVAAVQSILERFSGSAEGTVIFERIVICHDLSLLSHSMRTRGSTTASRMSLIRLQITTKAP